MNWQGIQLSAEISSLYAHKHINSIGVTILIRVLLWTRLSICLWCVLGSKTARAQRLRVFFIWLTLPDGSPEQLHKRTHPSASLPAFAMYPRECASAEPGANLRKRRTWALGNKDSNREKRWEESPGWATGLSWSGRTRGCGKEGSGKSVGEPLHLSGLKILHW